MLAIFFAAIIGTCISDHPTPVGYIVGAWAILALALAALAVPHIDLPALATNVGLALLGYNIALVVPFVARGGRATAN